MNLDFDVVIVGSGPAGVSAALPLANAGRRILLVDGGSEPTIPTPAGDYFSLRRHDHEQWRWMVGRNHTALRNLIAGSPKFRAPGLGYVFDGFTAAARIAAADNFMPVGSLATGGLSNAWGGGVAAFDADDLADFPFPLDALRPHYGSVARRIGLSGQCADDLADYFGIDAWAQMPVALDGNHSSVMHRYERQRPRRADPDFRLGRARLAVLTQALGDRQACDESGTCLWGCHRRSIYSAAQEIAAISQRSRVSMAQGVVVEALRREEDGWEVCGQHRLTGSPFRARTRRVVLAAGALASARLALAALRHDAPVRLLSNPIAAFLLWLPARFGVPPDYRTGLAQLSFVASGLTPSGAVFGNLFSPLGLPTSEFIRHIPLARRHAADLLRVVLPSTIVGNCFLPGQLSDHQLRVDHDGAMHIKGGFDATMHDVLARTQRYLRKRFGALGAVMLPGGFVPGVAGADVHYAGSIPMRRSPAAHEAGEDGEVAGLPGVFVVDGAALSSLPAKAHTLTIMANAERIATRLAAR